MVGAPLINNVQAKTKTAAGCVPTAVPDSKIVCDQQAAAKSAAFFAAAVIARAAVALV